MQNKIQSSGYIPDYPYRILINRSYRSGKINTLFMLTTNENINLYAKDLNEPKCQLLIKEMTGIKHLNDSKAFNNQIL